MNRKNLATMGKKINLMVNKRTPEILIGVGIGGMITSTVMAVKVTPKAIRLIEDECQNRDDDYIDKKDIVKLSWKLYTPATIIGGLSVGCILASHSVSTRRSAAIATAYAISETALNEYQGKLSHFESDEHVDILKNAINKDHLDSNPIEKQSVIVTNNGDNICYDSISGRYFKSSITAIEKAVNKINEMMLNDSYVSLNDFYYELGLDNIKLGEDLGWNVNNGLLIVDFDSNISSDGQPCIVIDYKVTPRYDYL